jgi:hypothetical protein
MNGTESIAITEYCLPVHCRGVNEIILPEKAIGSTGNNVVVGILIEGSMVEIRPGIEI